MNENSKLIRISSWMQSFWVSCLESSQFGSSNTGTGYPGWLWNVFKTWLDGVLGNLHWVILLEQGNWTRWSQEALPTSVTLGFHVLWTGGSQGTFWSLEMQPVFNFREQSLVSILAKYSFCPDYLLWTICFPCFCFQVCFIQHECSRHLP